jgi:hypothetical protein
MNLILSVRTRSYKVARVDEQESALAKEMREKNTKTKAASKIIQRKLAAVFTQVCSTDQSQINGVERKGK